jgi:m7GpppX diphosphatase
MDSLLNDYINLIGGKNINENKNRKKKSYKNKRENFIRSRYLESYEDYKDNVLPEGLTRNRQWVYDIFDGKKEKERILYQNSDFSLIPDIKWDGKDKWELRIVAFFKDKELHSMRDLTGEHIELLEQVKNTSCKIIKQKFELNEDQLKIFFHYRPTVWQLHMHFHCLFLKHTSSSIERAHSIYSVLENLKLDTDYFKKVKIHCFNDIE